MTSEKAPNFFLVGAPKCGTTSLSAWLREHSSVYMCEPKEPFFFSSDIRSVRAAETLDEYLSLFSGATQQHTAIGEASTTYLRSRVAIPRILELFPQSRFIVCLRNPVEMVASVHAQLLSGGRETEADLATAWALQSKRYQGIAIPHAVMEPNDLQYAQMCSLGEQIQRLLQQVSRDRILFVFLEDIGRDPRNVYSQVLSFLELPDDGRKDFGIENPRVMPRSLLMTRLLMGAVGLKYRLGIRRGLGLGTILMRLSNRRARPSEIGMDQALRKEITSYLYQDIELLGRLLGRDLSNWHRQTEK